MNAIIGLDNGAVSVHYDIPGSKDHWTICYAPTTTDPHRPWVLNLWLEVEGGDVECKKSLRFEGLERALENLYRKAEADAHKKGE